jgi:ADP-heptose:LPS heptosyltransferase
MTASPESVLVYVGLDRFGDGLMKLPFLRALRATWPAARITWLAGKGPTVYAGLLKPLVAGLADEVIESAGIGLATAELLRRPLPGRRFDLVLDTQRRLMTSLIVRRIAHGRYVSGAAGWLLSDAKPADRAKPPAMIGQMLRLIEAASGSPVDPLGARIAVPPEIEDQARHLLPDGPAYVGLAPGAGDRRKCWPLDRFIELAKRLPAPVVLLGPGESDWSDELHRALPGARFPLQAGADGPLLSIAVARRLAVAVANDAGMGHLLAAGDCPLVSLFGPTPAEKFAPFAAMLEVVDARNFGSLEMSAIPVDAVAGAVERLLTGTARPG